MTRRAQGQRTGDLNDSPTPKLRKEPRVSQRRRAVADCVGGVFAAHCGRDHRTATAGIQAADGGRHNPTDAHADTGPDRPRTAHCSATWRAASASDLETEANANARREHRRDRRQLHAGDERGISEPKRARH